MALQQFPFDDVVHVDELVVIGEIALEEIVHLGDDLRSTIVREHSWDRRGRFFRMRRPVLRQELRQRVDKTSAL